MADKKSAEETGRALCAAAQVGDLCETEDLLEAGADANYRDEKGSTPLHHCSWHGWTLIVEMLLEHGADPLITNNRLNVALHFAYERQHEEIVLLLVNAPRGVDALKLKNDLGMTPQRLAQIGSKAIAAPSEEELLPARYEAAQAKAAAAAEAVAKADAAGDGGAARRGVDLCAASQVGDLCQVDDLIEAGADVNFRDGKGSTPLMHASWHGWTPIIELLVEHGADVTLTNSKGNSALHFAQEQNHTEIVEILLKAPNGSGCSSLKNSEGVTPSDLSGMSSDALAVKSQAKESLGSSLATRAELDAVAEKFRAKVEASCRDLLAAHAKDANLNKAYGESDALLAELHDEEEGDGGASVDQVDGEGQEGQRKPHLFGREIDHIFEEACILGSPLPILLALIDDKGANINYANPKGATPLMHACYWNRVPIVKLLVTGHAGQKADVLAQSSFGSTALHFAYEHNREPLIKFLLDNGARPCLEVKNVKGLTPVECTNLEHLKHIHVDTHDLDEDHATMAMLCAACRFGEQDKVATLLDCGLDEEVNEPGPDGRTALVHAILAGQDNVAKMLVIEYCASCCVVMQHDGMANKDGEAEAGSPKKEDPPPKIKRRKSAALRDEGRTALHIAYANSQFLVIKTLLMYCEDAPDALVLKDAGGKIPSELCPYECVKKAPPELTAQTKAVKEAFVVRLKNKGAALRNISERHLKLTADGKEKSAIQRSQSCIVS